VSAVDLIVTDGWREAFPFGSVGLLTLDNLANASNHPRLDAEKAALEADLRDRYGNLTRAELRALPVLGAYAAYYRRFDKTYHVQLQLESVALKGKPIGSVSSLVETMFMAEMKNHLLTAVHDRSTIVPPLSINHAVDPTPYVLANGNAGALRPGDMYMADAGGPICSIIYGQDRRTRVTPSTTSALFVVYAPPGIDADAVDTHLADITTYVRIVSPDAIVTDRRVVQAAS
jgi:DNA/RNA-binding domain of Phe-tRNA-synthetase-like protein